MHSTPDDPISNEIAILQKPLKGRRFLSWLFFIVFVTIFLVAPIIASTWPGASEKSGNFLRPVNGAASSQVGAIQINTSTGKATAINSTYMGLDVPWNPGHLSNSHQPWANDCKVCHTAAFTRVKDEDCTACHQKMGDHVDSKIVKVDTLHEVRCASCHRDHQGEFGLAQQNKRYTGDNCAACHADIKASFPKTKTENVKDFSKDHPEFRIQLATGPDMLVRMRQNARAKLVETAKLKFPHDVHLASAGVSSPKGKVKMECDNCHKPNSDGVTFKPVTMKDDCQSCHALKFEPAVSNREVPHGSTNEVLSTLREFYSYVSTNGVKVDQRPENGPIFYIRPGKKEAVASYVSAPGDVRSRAVASATELFEKTSCVVCHEVTRSSEMGKKGTPGEDMPQWKIAPVTPQHAWMPKAQFSHVKHVSAKCADCHDAAKSKDATDVLMPTISQCKDCHSGKEPVVKKVTSDCGLCHGFHMPSGSSPSKEDKVHVTTAAVSKQ